MQHRSALILAAAATSFVLVLAGSVAARWPTTVPGAGMTVTAGTTSAKSTESALLFSAQQAADIARTVGVGTIIRRTPELVNFRGQAAYEVILDLGTVYVDAATGKVITSVDATQVTQPVAVIPEVPVSPALPAPVRTVSSDVALATAARYLPGERPVAASLEKEHGVMVYEVKFSSGSEVYVDAETGQVVYAEVEQSSERRKVERRAD